MAQKSVIRRIEYDRETDILTLFFTDTPQEAVAEEAASEIWVRYEPETLRVITLDVHHFSERIQSAFGEDLTYTERTDPMQLEQLVGLLNGS